MAQILVVDDSWLTRRGLKNMLEGEGHGVLEASNGQEALSVVETASPEFIVLDLLMPEMDGFEVLGELKKRGSKIPAIVVTADIQDTAREKCLSLGAAGFLNKPPEKEALLKLINEISPIK